jgi:hypothetical protein
MDSIRSIPLVGEVVCQTVDGKAHKFKLSPTDAVLDGAQLHERLCKLIGRNPSKTRISYKGMPLEKCTKKLLEDGINKATGQQFRVSIK